MSLYHQYDSLCKHILSYKIILAYILKQVIYEFKDFSIETIMKEYIKDDFSNEELSQLLSGDRESNTLESGHIRFDILFSTHDPYQRKGILFNIEAQYSEPSHYKLENRMQYYVSRLVSLQKQTIFIHSQYNDIYKVFTIWIILKPHKEHRNKIYHYETKETNMQYQNPYENIMHQIVINLGGEGEGYTGICKTLDILLSKEKSREEKIQVLEKEIGIEIPKQLKGETEFMCTLGQGLINEGKIEGKNEGILEAIISLKNNLHMTDDEAMSALNIPQSDKQQYLKQLQNM